MAKPAPPRGAVVSRPNGAAILVFGPAPRPLDLFEVRVNTDGGLVVDTGAIVKGSQDNPKRVVPYAPAPSMTA